MVKNDERFFFIIELGRLLDEYHKCPYEAVKKSIYEDIVLLRHAIGPDSIDSAGSAKKTS
ncbi:hypothetical protein RP319_06170 [Heyndrickxia coagulans]|uniref:hypothetical protein n=1 Tax=Heyndrickxia coagulans TaxID=1398 RepID=UPI0028FBC03F|nr:hypothetical protein [Heyndrickxia coagulans]MDT9755765.1 hypothetical protein [Heyndrickxia coagulans]